MHNTTHGHQSDVTRAQRGSVTYPSRRRRDTNKPQGKLFPFSFSPKPQVHQSTTQKVGHQQNTLQATFIWSPGKCWAIVPLRVGIVFAHPCHHQSSMPTSSIFSSGAWTLFIVHLNSQLLFCFIWRASWAVLSACCLLLLYQQELFQYLENDQTLPKTDIHGRAQGERAQLTWHQIFFSLSAILFLADTLPIHRETIDNWQSTKPNKDPDTLYCSQSLIPGLVTHVLPCIEYRVYPV